MTKIYPVFGNQIRFDYENNEFEVVPIDDLSITDLDGRVAFHRSDKLAETM